MNNAISKLRMVKCLWMKDRELRKCFRILKELEFTENVTQPIQHVINNNLGCYYYKRHKYQAALLYFKNALAQQQSAIVLVNVQLCLNQLNQPTINPQRQTLSDEQYVELKWQLVEPAFNFRAMMSTRRSNSLHQTPIQTQNNENSYRASQIRRVYCLPSPRILPSLKLKQDVNTSRSIKQCDSLPKREFISRLLMSVNQKHLRLQQIVWESYAIEQQIKGLLQCGLST